MKVKVYPYREKVGMGNIIWNNKYPMKAGKFPSNHPVGGAFSGAGNSQCGNGSNIDNFRERGYWASCFPEGDGITWEPKNNQTDEQCLKDIRECFNWDVELAGPWEIGI